MHAATRRSAAAHAQALLMYSLLWIISTASSRACSQTIILQQQPHTYRHARQRNNTSAQNEKSTQENNERPAPTTTTTTAHQTVPEKNTTIKNINTTRTKGGHIYRYPYIGGGVMEPTRVCARVFLLRVCFAILHCIASACMYWRDVCAPHSDTNISIRTYIRSHAVYVKSKFTTAPNFCEAKI